MEPATTSNTPASGHSVVPDTPTNEPSNYLPFVSTDDDGVHHLALKVEGIHCSRCIWAIESALQKEPDIQDARVNMSTSRLNLSWQGAREQADHYAALVTQLGYAVQPFEAPATSQQSDTERSLLRCMAIAGFAMGNIMLISVAVWSSDQSIMGIATQSLLHWISALIALPTILYAGRPFFVSAYSALRHGRTNMDVPISLALILASAMSLVETLRHGEHAYFDSAVMLLFFLLIGRWLDARARGKARENAESLLAMMHGTATIISADGTLQAIAIQELREDMQIRITAGEKVPTDAEIIAGHSSIDTSLVTGESLPKQASVGDTIYGGTINLDAPLTCRVLKASEDSLLADIVRLLEQAEQGRARYVRLADKAAGLYTPVVHTLAACAFIGWYAFGGLGWQDSLLIAITTLIITCPCALGLAVPVVQVLATSWLMKRGILVKSGDALERLAAIDTVIFDKTGTLTQGTPELQESTATSEQLQLAASLAAHSKHPYSQAISRAYSGSLLELDDLREISGSGIRAIYQQRIIMLGKSEPSKQASTDQRPQITLSIGDAPAASFYFSDPLRIDAEQTIAQLQQAGLTPHLLSGDRPSTAQQVAETLGISHWHANQLPADKTRYIHQLQQDGHHVLMTGDGLNDAPALAAANISISPATGVDITQNSADIVFRGALLRPVLDSWHMAKLSTQLVKQNFALALLYNCIAIPLALAGHVTPLIAALAMSSSSLIVIANSLRINLRHPWESA